jgi:hypothetical protein
MDDGDQIAGLGSGREVRVAAHDLLYKRGVDLLRIGYSLMLGCRKSAEDRIR